jgi:hypothetical protein
MIEEKFANLNNGGISKYANSNITSSSSASSTLGQSTNTSSSSSSIYPNQSHHSQQSVQQQQQTQQQQQQAQGGQQQQQQQEPEAETDKVVGYGAFGVVWSVTDPRSGKRVALKKMPNVFQTVVSAKRVFREVKMLCSLKHDNVSLHLTTQNTSKSSC